MLTQRDKNILPGGRDHETAMRLLNEPEAVLQWRDGSFINRWHDFGLFQHPQFDERYEWRIKPKTRRFRVCKWRTLTGSVDLGFARDDAHEKAWEGSRGFIEWTGDWQEVEV